MGQSSTLKKTFTGSQIKALMSTPTANTEETIRLISGLAGASGGDTVIINKITLQTTVQPGITATILFNPNSPSNSPLEIDSVYPSINSDTHFMSGGNLDATIRVYDDGKFLSDISDSLSFDIYIECALVTTAPGINADTVFGPTGATGVVGATGVAGVDAKYYAGTTQKTLPIIVTKTASVSSGVAVFHFTNDGTSGGTALFTNGPDTNSVAPSVNDAAASYQFGWAWSNSNKTLTITTNKLTTANILSGVLGQAAANGSTCTVTVWGN